MLLVQIQDPFNVTTCELQSTYEELAAQFNNMLNYLGEAVTAPIEGDLDQQLAELSKRFDAARRGLSIVHKLRAGPEKKQHMSRVLSNLNVIRGQIMQVMKAIQGFERAEDDYSNTDDVQTQTPVAVGF